MNIVVTGGAGFIGSRLVKRLSEMGHDVVSWDLQASRPRDNGRNRILDVRDLNEVKSGLAGVDAIYHLAGPVVEFSRKNPYESWMLQQAGTLAVLEACRTSQVGKVLLASSFYVYDGIDEKMIVNEETPLDIFRMELYGVEKLMAEGLVKAYATKYGIEHVILRYGSAYGSGNCTSVLKTFLEMGFRSEPIEIWGRGQRRNQYTYVDDIVEGCVLALDEKFETFNLISPEETTTGELADLLKEMHGFDVVFNEVQKEGLSMPYMSSRKASERLDWMPINLREGIARTVQDMKHDPSETWIVDQSGNTLSEEGFHAGD